MINSKTSLELIPNNNFNLNMPVRLSNLHKWVIYIILIANGYQFILPVNFNDDALGIYINLPKWATSFEVINGVFFADFIFIFYYLFFGFRIINYTRRFGKAIKFALGIISLAFAGILSTAFNLEIFSDYLESLKLVLLALFFLCVFFWSTILGPLTVLRLFMFGVVISSIVNLYFTFSNPIRLLGGLPMLLGQNGPGGSAGFLMFLPSFFLGLTNKKIDKLFIFFYVVILSILLLLSYSKLGVLMGMFGMLSLFFFQFRSARPGFILKRMSYIFVLLITIFVLIFNTDAGKSLSDGVSVFIEHKIGDDGAGAFDSGDEERLNYYFAVSEVLLYNPLFGVGYNGFFEAIIKTKTYSSGLMSEEESSVNANPHNAFLYYISANGFIGWIIVVFLYFTFLNFFFNFFKPYGLAGVLMFLSLAAASVLHTNTLIGFFNTTIMYIPAGVALAENYKRKI